MQAPLPDHEANRLPDNQPEMLQLPAQRVTRLARYVWGPTPVCKPVISSDLEQLSWPERSVAVVSYALLSLEYWLSRGGLIREWVRLNLRLAVVFIIAALLVIPPVTAILEGVRDWTRLLGVTMANINLAITKVPPIILALATVYLVVRLIQRHRFSRRHSRPNQHPDYDQY